MRPIIIYEREHLRLRCAATGFPKPDIEWAREDGKTINTGTWEGMMQLAFAFFFFFLSNYENFYKKQHHLWVDIH